MKKILGISAFFHDSSAALILDGEIVSAVQEERFTRIKHDSSFPINSINYILKEEKIDLGEIDKIIFFEKPFLKFERLIETYIHNVPKGFSSFKKAIPIWIKEKLFQKKIIVENLKLISKNFDENNLLFCEHHLSHAASAFYPSPFDKAIILTIDGVGEWATTTVSIGDKNKIELKEEINFPNSLGLLYSAFTFYLGFKVNSGEYKIMGLAPYGKPKYFDKILNHLIHVNDDGSFRMNQNYFDYSTGLKMVNSKFEKLFNNPRRLSENEISQFHMDVAASIQKVIEYIILKICRYLSKKYKLNNLCLAGGVALNCVANGKILNEKIFQNLWIQPASGDAGTSIGAALYYWHNELNKSRKIDNNDKMKGSFLGPKYNNHQIVDELKQLKANFEKYSNEEMLDLTARFIADGKAVGWFNGRMEFGPRSLGCRSILADPRKSDMQKTLNLKIKYRESFRPFAPAVLFEDVSDWFNLKVPSPYMLLVSEVLKDKQLKVDDDDNSFGIEKLNKIRSLIPSVTHVDYSARVQTVHKETNPNFHKLIKKFKEITNCPVILNTSFNIRGEPIVCNVRDAFKCFMGTELDVLVIENNILIKSQQDVKLIRDYRESFELD